MIIHLSELIFFFKIGIWKLKIDCVVMKKEGAHHDELGITEDLKESTNVHQFLQV